MESEQIQITNFNADRFTLTWLYRAIRLPELYRVDDGDKFISLWICFNSILRNEYGEHRTDHELIEEASKERSLFQPIFQSLLETDYFRANFNQLKIYKVLNMRYPSDVTKAKQVLEDTFHDLIWVIYSIRCNLFHGRKDPSDISPTDKDLISLAYELLSPIINHYLEERGLIEICEVDGKNLK
jgi:hypothetical protein